MSLDKVLDGLSAEQLAALGSLDAIRWRTGATFTPTPRQLEAQALLDGRGARSGKTTLIMKTIIGRALTVKSRHCVLRYRFSHVITSIALDTLGKVMRTCYPGAVEGSKLDRSLWVFHLPNGSEIWFGGLDEPARAEKILGQEHSSIFLNECSQIPAASRQIAVTRLAENVGLKQKLFYDANPPSRRHWCAAYFIDKIDPNRNTPLVDPSNYVAMQMNPEHNKANLTPEFLHELAQLDERRRQRFLLGQFSDDSENALFTPEMLDRGRLLDRDPPPLMRVVVAVDPSGCSGPEDLRSDEIGIVVAGIANDGIAYVLEDCSLRAGPDQWKRVVASAFHRWRADCVVAETNYGGAMVKEVLRTASADNGMPIPFKEVSASRGKVIRAEPIAALFAQGRVALAGRFKELEDQLLAMTTAGYRGDKSPDRADAMVWALTSLFPAVVSEARRARRDPPKVVMAYAHAKQHLVPRQHRNPQVVRRSNWGKER